MQPLRHEKHAAAADMAIAREALHPDVVGGSPPHPEAITASRVVGRSGTSAGVLPARIVLLVVSAIFARGVMLRFSAEGPRVNGPVEPGAEVRRFAARSNGMNSHAARMSATSC